MNTRLQVEHPVTELVTGLDLVHLQIRIAAGENVALHARRSAAFAAMPSNAASMPRIPTTIIFPAPARSLCCWRPSGPGIRRDSGMYEGWTVPMDYDPLLAKLIGYGTDRDQAIARLTRALDEYFVGGIKTNISLFRRILRDPDFRAAKLDTGFLDRMLKRTEDKAADAKAGEVAAIAAGMFAALGSTAKSSGNGATGGSSKGESEKVCFKLEGYWPPRSSALRYWDRESNDWTPCFLCSTT